MGKIPDHARRVFHGKLFDVYQWEQTLYDGSTTIFEKIRRIPSTEVIAVDGDQIIISEQEQPGKGRFLSLFGGAMHPGEPTDPLEHAKKELLEESGYIAKSWTHLETSNFPWEKLDWDNHLFVAKELEKVQEPTLDGGEKITLRRVSFDEFLALSATDLHWGPLTGLFRKVANPDKAAWLRDQLF